jgi:hypothetical protein
VAHPINNYAAEAKCLCLARQAWLSSGAPSSLRGKPREFDVDILWRLDWIKKSKNNLTLLLRSLVNRVLRCQGTSAGAEPIY